MVTQEKQKAVRTFPARNRNVVYFQNICFYVCVKFAVREYEGGNGIGHEGYSYFECPQKHGGIFDLPLDAPSENELWEELDRWVAENGASYTRPVCFKGIA